MKALLEQIQHGELLHRKQARDVLLDVSQGAYSDAEIAAFVMALTMRSVSLEELEGFRDALLSLCIPISLGDVQAVDLCGTGGDGKNTFNISTLAAILLASAGVPVVKHGNYGVTSTCGSSNVLEALGIRFPQNEQEVLESLHAHGIAFIHAPLFHPAMKAAAGVRRALGIRTFFNLLGPLVNPAQPPFQSTGVCTLDVQRLYSSLLQRSSVLRYYVCHSYDGYDEVSLTGTFRVTGRRTERVYRPEEFGMTPVTAEDLFGGESIADAATLFVDILEGRGTKVQEQVVVMNAAIARSCVTETDLRTNVDELHDVLQSGAAAALLSTLRG